MTELEMLQDAGFRAAHIGESRNASALRELEALSRFLRDKGYHDAAEMTDGLQDFMRGMMQEGF